MDEDVIVNAAAWTTQTPSMSTNLYKTQLVRVGAAVGVAADVSQDNISITLNLTGTMTEFLGYDDPGQSVPKTLPQFPLPHFWIRQVITSAKVRDGQTLLIGGLVNERYIKKIKKAV